MKAIILAAGKGERLKDITQNIPKPMIEYKGKPVLQYNIELCKKYGVEEIFINLHHLPDIVTDYFEDGSKFGVKITYSFEKELLGTSGAVRKISDEYWTLINSESQSHTVSKSPSPFFVIYGDQISNFNLSSLKEKFDKENKVNDKLMGVVAFHYREDVEHSGVAEFDGDYRIRRFVEKPKKGETESHWVNAGVYLLDQRIIEFIPTSFSDFGRNIFPELSEKKYSLYGVCEKKDVDVFDTPEMYKKSFSK